MIKNRVLLFFKELLILTVISLVITIVSFRFIYPELGLPEEYPLPIRIMTIFLMISHFIYNRRKRTWRSYGLKRPKNFKTFLGAFFFLLIFELIFKGPILSLVYQFYDLNPPNYSAFSHIEGNTKSLLYFILLSILNGGFAEEMIFRGYLLFSIEEIFSNRNIGSIIAVIVQSIVFGIFHSYQGISGVIATTIIGVFFGIAMLFSRNLWPLIIFHGLMDTLGFILIYNGGIEAL